MTVYNTRLVQEDGVGLCFSAFPPGPTDSQVIPAKAAHCLFLLSQVEAVIHPRFLAQLLSPGAQLNLLALEEELEQEEGLTLAQVSQWREPGRKVGGGLQVNLGREGP